IFFTKGEYLANFHSIDQEPEMRRTGIFVADQLSPRCCPGGKIVNLVFLDSDSLLPHRAARNPCAIYNHHEALTAGVVRIACRARMVLHWVAANSVRAL